MNELFVPYHISLLAKEKGFQEQCFARWNGDEFQIVPINNWNAGLYSNHVYKKDITGTKVGTIKAGTPTTISALLYQQLVNWFRKVHNLEVALRLSYPPGYSINIQYVNSSKTATRYSGTIIILDYYEAYNKALEEAFKLI